MCTGQRAHEGQECVRRIGQPWHVPSPASPRLRAPGSCRHRTPFVVTGTLALPVSGRAVATTQWSQPQPQPRWPGALPPAHSMSLGWGARVGPLWDSTLASPSLLLIREAGG